MKHFFSFSSEATMANFFDDDLNMSDIDDNIYEIYELTNTCEYDLDNLTIIDSLPIVETDEPCHMSRLSIYADSTRLDYEIPVYLQLRGLSVIVEGGSLSTEIWGE